MMDRQELAFASALEAAVLANDWPGWTVTRLAFADWLAECDDPREHLTRAPWQRTGKRELRKENSVMENWMVRLPRAVEFSARFLMLTRQGCINAQPLLHFAPGDLKVMEPLDISSDRAEADWTFGALRFTWKPRRKLTTWFDVGAHRMGFAALFHPEPGEY